MPELIPVENDPFNPSVNLVPIDHDPFALQGDVGAAIQQQNAVEAQRRATAGGLLGHFMTPGRVAQGVQPETPGVMTEADAYRLNQLEDQAQSWAPQQAMNMIGTGVPMAQSGALGVAGGKVITHSPTDITSEYLKLSELSEAAHRGEGIRAYHGSPYDFEKFDLSKIGTGEGAQAYGHGLYFAENPATAQSYKEALGMRNSPASYAEQLLTNADGDVDKALAAARSPEQSTTSTGRMFGEDAIKHLEMLKRGEKPPTAGKMYEVNINADPEHFLDWDKPLSEQSPGVADKLSTIVKDRNRTAADWINSSPGAEERLRDAGIPGIKYLDQGSRVFPNIILDQENQVAYWKNLIGKRPDAEARVAQEQAHLDELKAKAAKPGTSNYVVFNDKLIDIIKKYGLAGLVAGGAWHFTTTPIDHNPFAAQQ